MSYDSPDSPRPAPRRFNGRSLTVALAALVPTALAGWLLWQALGGPEESEPPRMLPAPSSSSSDGRTGQEKSPSPSKQENDKNGKGDKDDKAGKGDDGASGKPTAKPASGPLKGKVVVIDPGHNTNNRNHATEINKLVDIGTGRKACDTTGTSTNTGYAEAEFTLDVSHRLRDLLEQQGATVRFTHDGDRAYGPCVDERARAGNEAKADAAVSIHADGSGAGNRGFHVILPGSVRAGAADTRAIVAPSKELGERIAGTFVHATGSAPSNYIGGGTGLDTREDLGGLNLSKVPKVFLECGNMRDSEDAALLTSGSWRQKAARGISDGIAGFLRA